MKAIEEMLDEITSMKGVEGALVASTSGAHIAGKPPSSAHLETFTTMSAILLGAAQTATKELKDALHHIEVELNKSRLIIHPVGTNALLVMEVTEDGDMEAILNRSREIGESMSKAL